MLSLIKTEYTIIAPVNFTIALVTDLHEYNPEAVLKILKEVKPDVIAIAGDTLERHEYGENLDKCDQSAISRLICSGIHLADKFLKKAEYWKKRDICAENSYRLLQEAADIAPVVMSLGNHELYLTREDRRVMEQAGIHLLDNASVEIKGILFGGLTSKQLTGEFDKEFLEDFSACSSYKVLLSHHPEYYDYLRNFDIDLVLAGHCHGGQIRVKYRGLFAPGQGLFPKYHHGIYDRMIVSAGTANTASIPRWGNPCEVVVVNLNG